MKKLFQTNYVAILLLLVIPLFSFAQEEGDTFRDIDPPPTPIDNYIIHCAVAAVLLAGFYFYKTNLKTKTK